MPMHPHSTYILYLVQCIHDQICTWADACSYIFLYAYRLKLGCKLTLQHLVTKFPMGKYTVCFWFAYLPTYASSINFQPTTAPESYNSCSMFVIVIIVHSNLTDMNCCVWLTPQRYKNLNGKKRCHESSVQAL